REHAERLGIQAFPPKELRGQPRRPVVADVSASPSGLQAALASTAPDGVCTSSGMLHRTTRIPTLELYSRNVTLSISRIHARALIPPVLDLIVEGKLRPQEVTTTVAPLDDAPDVLREHYLGGGTKTILTA
ncbi:MAG TPA: hypothetical protein VE780_12295, partial [Thermoleophilaceae bacterium]|nr:hypothetical protein [Thermoleophilaceae bacterium]